MCCTAQPRPTHASNAHTTTHHLQTYKTPHTHPYNQPRTHTHTTTRILPPPHQPTYDPGTSDRGVVLFPRSMVANCRAASVCNTVGESGSAGRGLGANSASFQASEYKGHVCVVMMMCVCSDNDVCVCSEGDMWVGYMCSMTDANYDVHGQYTTRWMCVTTSMLMQHRTNTCTPYTHTCSHTPTPPHTPTPSPPSPTPPTHLHCKRNHLITPPTHTIIKPSQCHHKRVIIHTRYGRLQRLPGNQKPSIHQGKGVIHRRTAGIGLSATEFVTHSLVFCSCPFYVVVTAVVVVDKVLVKGVVVLGCLYLGKGGGDVWLCGGCGCVGVWLCGGCGCGNKRGGA